MIADDLAFRTLDVASAGLDALRRQAAGGPIGTSGLPGTLLGRRLRLSRRPSGGCRLSSRLAIVRNFAIFSDRLQDRGLGVPDTVQDLAPRWCRRPSTGSPLMTLRQPATAILAVTMVVALTVLAFSPSLHAQQSSLHQSPRPMPLITRVTDREDACNNRCGVRFCMQCMGDGNYCTRDQDMNILNWGGNNLSQECQTIWDSSYTCWNSCMGR